MNLKRLLGAVALALLAVFYLSAEEGIEIPPEFGREMGEFVEPDRVTDPAGQREPPATPSKTGELQSVLLGTGDLAPTEAELFELINAERMTAGLPPYTVDGRLVAAARAHSTDMAEHDFCEHEGSDGSSAAERIERHGYAARWSGENIACGDDSPGEAVDRWMGSNPHRDNILHEQYTHIGVGVAPGGPWGPMWTLNFGAGGG